MKLSEAHSILECKQSMMTQYRWLFTPDEIKANGIAILALEEQMKCEPRIRTNLDKIRHMDDKELTHFLRDKLYPEWKSPIFCPDPWCENPHKCDECCLRWLGQEVEKNEWEDEINENDNA